MNVICTQSKNCKVNPINIINLNNQAVNLYVPNSNVLCGYKCKHITLHTHTPDCEIKCCDQQGVVKCRITG